jgi:hypothetical protein
LGQGRNSSDGRRGSCPPAGLALGDEHLGGVLWLRPDGTAPAWGADAPDIMLRAMNAVIAATTSAPTSRMSLRASISLQAFPGLVARR